MTSGMTPTICGQRGVQFIEQPRHESYGLVVVFLDLYGNKWDFVQRNGGP